MNKTILIFLVIPFLLSARNATSIDFSSAVRVEDYRDANYAYCSFKDRGVLIDLNEVNLKDNCREKIYFGVKSCHSDEPIRWMPDSSEVMVEVYEGYPQIFFLEYWESKMNTDPVFDGMMKKPAAFYMDHKNSECYFIQTHDTAGLPFSDDFECF